MRNNAYHRTELMQWVIAYGNACDINRAAGCVIKAGDHADQCRFARAGWADNAHSHTAANLQVDAFQHIVARAAVGEGNVVKTDDRCGNIGRDGGGIIVPDGGLRLQHIRYACGGSARAREYDDQVGDDNKGNHDLCHIIDQRDDLPLLEGAARYR